MFTFYVVKVVKVQDGKMKVLQKEKTSKEI